MDSGELSTLVTGFLRKTENLAGGEKFPDFREIGLGDWRRVGVLGEGNTWTVPTPTAVMEGIKCWSRNGRKLFYVAPGSRIMVVEYEAEGDSFVARKPRVWSPVQIPNPGYVTLDSLRPIATGPRPTRSTHRLV